MIALAKEKFQSGIYKNLEFFQKEAEDMCFPQESFDLIICTNVLMWVRQPRKALYLMINSLKPGGSIVILTYPTNTPYANLFKEVLNECFPELLEKSALKTMLSPKQDKELFEKSELITTLFEVADTPFLYKDLVHFKNYVEGWLVCYVPLNERQKEQFLDALCEKIHTKGYLTTVGGPIVIPHQTLKIIAKKPQ